MAFETKFQAEVFYRREPSTLRVGLEHLVPTAVLTPVMMGLRRHVREIRPTLQQGPEAAFCERMLEGEADVSLLVDAAGLHGRLHRWQIRAWHCVRLRPAGHLLCDGVASSSGEVAEARLRLNDDADDLMRRRLTEMFNVKGQPPCRQHYASDQEQITETLMPSPGVPVAANLLPIASTVVCWPVAAG